MPDTPLVLAFDTSAALCAAGLLSGDQILASAQEEMAKGQAERLMVLCQEILQSADISFQNLDAIGVGIGPGNFTGIRISVSGARGLALGLGKPAIGVSTFDALRWGAIGPCACAVDARQGQVYLKGYENPSLADPAQYDALSLPSFDGPLIGMGGQAPAFPIAEAIAQIAADRLGTDQPRPAPLNLRPADAAPPRDAPPVILP